MIAGKQLQATTNLMLDYTGLFSSGTESPTEAAETHETEAESKITADKENGLKGQNGGLQRIPEQIPAKTLLIQKEQAEADHKQSLRVYKKYQENILKSEQLQTEILKGLKAGEDIYSLFLKATKAISCMIDNELFYTQTEQDLKQIYGEGLLQKHPLQLELEEVQERLKKLTEAQERAEDKRRIQAAIKAHQSREAELAALLDKAI